MRQDLRLALRLFRKSRGSTVLSIVSIALGVGLTTGIFSVADAMLLRPFPVSRPGQLYAPLSFGDDGQVFLYGWPDYQDIVRSVGPAVGLAAFQRRSLLLTRDGDRQWLLATPATPNYFIVLGVRPALGRLSLGTDAGRPEAVIGHRLWMRSFGGDPGILGKTIVLSGTAFTIAGVLPAEFAGTRRGVANDVWVGMEAWFAIPSHRAERDDRRGQFELLARLSPGVTPDSVAPRIEAALRGPGKHNSPPPGARGTVLTSPFALDWRRGGLWGGGAMLIFGLVLFVACANVAQMRLAQAEARRKELGVRFALGAGAARVVRQLLLESALQGLAGAALGLWLAREIMDRANTFLSAGRTYIDYGIRLDHRVLLYCLSATLFAVLLTGLAPARHVLRLNLVEVLKSEQGGTGRRGWQKQALVVGQIAVSVVFFGMAVLSLLSLHNALAVRPGLDPAKKLLILSASPGAREPLHDWALRVSGRIAALPGVRGASFARRMPLSGSGGGASVRIDLPGQSPLGVHFNNVGPGYFAVTGTRIVAGRPLDANDRAGNPAVLVVSQTLARQVYGARTALGEWLPVNGSPRQIVGIAEDLNSNDLHEPPEPFLYFPFAQMPSGDFILIAETAGDPAALAPAARAAVRESDPRATVDSSITLRQHLDRALAGDSMTAALALVLGAFGLLLTAAGLFGVLQYTVSRRTREMGLRMALGAGASGIQRLVLLQSLRMAAIGAPLGLVLLAAAGRYLQSLVPLTNPFHPLAYCLSFLAAVVIAVTAGWIPALRATRVDPATALRSE